MGSVITHSTTKGGMCYGMEKKKKLPPLFFVFLDVLGPPEST